MSAFPELRFNRRRLAGLAAVTGVVPLLTPRRAGASPAPLPAAPTAAARSRRHRLRPESDSVVSALDLPVAGMSGLARSRGATRTPVIETDSFTMAGLTWRAGDGPVRARFRRVSGSWTPWQELEQLHDAPDDDEPSRGRHATDLVWTGRSDAVQLEVSDRLRGPELALIDPGERRADTVDPAHLRADSERAEARARARRGLPPVPGGMRWRGDWGAPESGPPERRVKSIRQMHVHHTVSTNNYSRGDVAGMIRGMHRYHTRNLGCSDIGYTFLVDKFGRIWVGRKGSFWYAQGAHTRGFNNTSFGVAVIGNFQKSRPHDRVVYALSRVAAWKLSRAGRNPTGKIWVQSQGSDKYRAGKHVPLPVIDGHRHTNQTACPGWFLFQELPWLRRVTKRRIRQYS